MVSFQYALRLSLPPDHWESHLAALLRLLTPDQGSQDERAPHAILPSLAHVVEALPVVSRWELFRACLSVYDSRLFSYAPSDSDSVLGMSNRLLFGYVFECIMRASNNSINNIRFAGMQLLETWLSLLEEYESLGTSSLSACCSSSPAMHPFDITFIQNMSGHSRL